MTSSVGLVALTYDGNDIQDLDGIFLDLHRGGPGEIADVRGTDWVVPTRDGETAGNRRLSSRRIELVGKVVGDGADKATQDADYWTNRIQIATWFDPREVGVLSATLPGGAVYTINARTVPPINYGQVAPMDATVVIVMLSVDPDWELAGS